MDDEFGPTCRTCAGARPIVTAERRAASQGAHHLVPGLRTRRAGVWRRSTAQQPEEAVRILRELGADAMQHRLLAYDLKRIGELITEALPEDPSKASGREQTVLSYSRPYRVNIGGSENRSLIMHSMRTDGRRSLRWHRTSIHAQPVSAQPRHTSLWRGRGLLDRVTSDPLPSRVTPRFDEIPSSCTDG